MLSGAEFTGELTRRLIERLPNLIAMKEASFNSEKFLEISRAALALRPNFSMVTGVEFLAPSVPLWVCRLLFLRRRHLPQPVHAALRCMHFGRRRPRARTADEDAAAVGPPRGQYPSSLKGGMVIMGRPVGPTRPPLPTATKERQAFIATRLEELGILDTEPHGW